MLQLLKFLLPVLIPSWRFFEVIEPSPRVQWVALEDLDQTARNWQEYCPRPQKISFWSMIGHLFWNPRWNEGLYMVSLAERLTLDPTPQSISEIYRLIAAQICGQRAKFLQFRLVFVQRSCDRAQGDLVQEVTYLSQPRPRDAIP